MSVKSILPHKRKNGERFPVLVNPSWIKDEQGNIISYFACVKDITERKKAEEFTLTQSEVTRNMTEGAYIVGLQDVIICYTNPKFEQMFGYEPGEMIGKHASIVNASTDLSPEERADEIMEAIRRTGKWHGEVYNIKKDGTPFWCYANVSTFTHPEYDEVLLAVHTDITERKRAEVALRESEEKYRLVAENVADIIIVAGMDLSPTYVSPSVARLTGYSVEEAMTLSLSDVLTPASFEVAISHFSEEQLIEQTEQKDPSRSRAADIEVRRRDGSTAWFELRVTFLRDPYSQAIGVLGVARDITERKKMEKELRESEEKFRSIVESSSDQIFMLDKDYKFLSINKTAADISKKSPQEMIGTSIFAIFPENTAVRFSKNVKNIFDTGKSMFIEEEMLTKGREFYNSTSLNPVKDAKGSVIAVIGIVRDMTEHKQLEEERQKLAKLESIGTLAGGIAHDFNNLLTGIMGYTSMAKTNVEPSGKVFSWLAKAEEASLRARDLTQQLLTFSRGGAPVKNTISIAGLLKESADFALRGSNIRCDIALPDALWLVEVDEGQINQVITNLVINAEEAMPEGGVININAKNTIVQSRSTLPLSKGRYVEITVVDSGVGIKKEHLDRIFDPYFTTKQKGSGLGLATSYSIIKAHGGYIAVNSTLGVGTSFQIYLPASKKAAPKKDEESKFEGVTTGEGRILVMDDEEIIRQFLHEVLTGIGFNKVVLTKDGVEAIECYSKAKESGQPFDAVIMDLTIPGGRGGKEAIKKLLEIDPGAKVIVSSGYSTDPIMSKYEQFGFSGVVTKPYRVDELKSVVQTVLHKTSEYETSSVKREGRRAAASAKRRILIVEDAEVLRRAIAENLPHFGFEVELARDGNEATSIFRNAMSSGRPFCVVLVDLTMCDGPTGEEIMKKLIDMDPDVKGIACSGYTTKGAMVRPGAYGFRAALAKPYGIDELSAVVDMVMRDER